LNTIIRIYTLTVPLALDFIERFAFVLDVYGTVSVTLSSRVMSDKDRMKLTVRECPDRMQPCSVNFDIHRIDHRTVFTILNRKVEKRK